MWSLIFIILFCGCTGFPTLHPHLMTITLDQQATNIAGHAVYTGSCTSFDQVSPSSDPCQNMSFANPKDLPLDQCDGEFGLPPEDVTKMLEYKAQQCAAKPSGR